MCLWGIPRGISGKKFTCQCRRLKRHIQSIPGLGRCPGAGNGNPLQYSCLRNSMDRGAWQDTVHGVAKSWTQLSTTRVIMIWPQLFVSKFISFLLYLLLDSHVNFLHFSFAVLFDICSLLLLVFPYIVLSSRIPWSPSLCVQTLPIF